MENISAKDRKQVMPVKKKEIITQQCKSTILQKIKEKYYSTKKKSNHCPIICLPILSNRKMPQISF